MPPERIETHRVFATRHGPKPIPIAFHRGARESGSPPPVAGADTILVCGFLGCDLRPFSPLVATLPARVPTSGRSRHLKSARILAGVGGASGELGAGTP